MHERPEPDSMVHVHVKLDLFGEMVYNLFKEEVVWQAPSSSGYFLTKLIYVYVYNLQISESIHEILVDHRSAIGSFIDQSST